MNIKVGIERREGERRERFRRINLTNNDERERYVKEKMKRNRTAKSRKWIINIRKIITREEDTEREHKKKKKRKNKK